MNGNHSIFSNYYRVLEIFYDHRVVVNEINYCAVTQSEIAKILGHDRMTISPIVKKLQEDGLIVKTPSKSKQYIISDDAIKLVKSIKKL